MRAGDAETRDPSAQAKGFAVLAAIILIPFSAFVWLVTGINSQEGWEQVNELSATLSFVSALGLLAAGIACIVYAARGRGLAVIVAGGAVGGIALGLWIYGMSAWCSSCGVP